MEVIILAGGKGRRLKSIVKKVPKPMADINGKPFLLYIFDYLLRYDISSVILSVGYKKEVIKRYFKKSYKGISLVYSNENKPLGTGGGIKEALKYCKNDYALVINGDTFCNIDLEKFMKKFDLKEEKISIALTEMKNVDRYGSVEIQDNKIISFKEKKYYEKTYINTGIYLIKKDIFNNFDLANSFSFENFLETNIKNLNNSYFLEKDIYFIDIGIPCDYEKAKSDFKELF